MNTETSYMPCFDTSSELAQEELAEQFWRTHSFRLKPHLQFH